MLLEGRRIVRAETNRIWPGDANLTVSLVWISNVATLDYVLNGKATASISSSLDEGEGATVRILSVHPFTAGLGAKPYGEGFLLQVDEAKRLSKYPVIQPYFVGQDLNDMMELEPRRWIINLGDVSEEEASRRWPECFRLVEERVKPTRVTDSDKRRRTYWWQFERHAKELYDKMKMLSRSFGLSRVSKFHSVRQLVLGPVYSSDVVVFATDRYSDFCRDCSIILGRFCGPLNVN